MAESVEKSKKLEDDGSECDFDYFLPKIRRAIEAKVESILSPVSFEAAVRTYSGYLSSALPQSVWSELFQSDASEMEAEVVGKERDQESNSKSSRPTKSSPESDHSASKPGPVQSGPEPGSDETKFRPKSEAPQLSIDRLSLHELIMISQTLPPVKTKLSREETRALDRLRELLREVYTEFLLKSEPGEKRENRYRSIEAKLADILSDLGSDKTWTEEAGSTSQEDLFGCANVFRDEVLKKIDQKSRSADESQYSEKEREKLRKLVDDARDQKKRGPSDTGSFFALRESLNAAVRRALTCGYCRRTPEEPRTLPCLHVCCSACLKSNFVDNSARAGSASGSAADKQTISCPLCHTRISMPSAAHVDQLPRGFVAGTLLKLREVSAGARKAENSSPECYFCINAPTHVCLLCSDFYCQEHISGYYKHGDADDDEEGVSHAEMISPLSALTSVDRITPLLYQFCPQHRRRISRFCPGCRVPLCSNPLCVDWHSQHAGPIPGLRPIEEVIVEEHEKLAAAEILLRKKAEKIRVKIDLVEKNQISVAEVQENVRQSIEKYFNDIEEKLAKQKVAFLSDLDKAAAQCFQNDETIHSRLQTWTEENEKVEGALRRYLDDRSSTGGASNADPASAIASVPELASLRFRILRQLSDSCSGALVASAKRLSYPEARLRELQHQAGTLLSNITTAPAGRGWESLIKFATGITPSSIGSPLHFVIDSAKNAAFVIKGRGLVAMSQVLSYDLKRADAGAPRAVCDAGARSFETLAIDSQSRRLFVAEQPQSVLELPTMRFKRFTPVRSYELNTIGFATPLRTASLEHMNSFSKAMIKYVSGRLYVCDGVCVCEYEAADEFKLTRKFNFHNMLEIADFAAEPKRDFLYVVDGKKHCLLIFDCEQRVVKSVGEQGVTPGRFDQPSGVALDEFGHVFVADAGNFRVQVLDADGGFLRLIQYPQAVKETNQSLTATSDQRSGASAASAKVALQAADDGLYMCDSRSDQLWRYRYM